MSKKIEYEIQTCKGLSLYFDERVEKLDMVLSKHLNNEVSGSSRRFSGKEFSMLYKLHNALTDYLDYYGIC